MSNKISIVIPSYNSAQSIGNTLESITNQSYSNYEVILADGGSSDATVDIFLKYFPSSRYFSEPDKGVADALNKGFSICSGSYLCWLNSDDQYYDHNALFNLISTIEKKRCDWAIGHSVIFDKISNRRKYLTAWVPDKAKNIGTNIFTGSLIFKKNCWEMFNGFSTNYRIAFEYELIKFLIENFHGSVCQAVCAQFNLSKNSLSYIYSDQMLEEKMRIYSENKINRSITTRLDQVFSYIRQGSFIRFLYFLYLSSFSGNKYK